MARQKKMTREDRAKRAARNERRGRNAQPKSDDKPRIAYGAGPQGLGQKAMVPGEGTQRAINTVLENAKKWAETKPCECNRCVERRRLEAEFKRGKTRLERA